VARRAFDVSNWSRDVEFRYHCLTQLADALENQKEH
jgi:aldehyde dehydrogenase (NAD+)